MHKNQGVVACGHPETAKAAQIVLEAGGNAFDAALAALAAACVAEPVLVSLAGGGFLLAHTGDDRNMLYDFFTQTPSCSPIPGTLDFYPIVADFGPVQQEFHIGMGSIATPGLVMGMFEIHRDLCSLPMGTILEPAIEIARNGVELNALQSHIFEIVAPIYYSNPDAHALYASVDQPERLVREGERLRSPQLADTLDALAREGADLFYRGEIGKHLARACRELGGLVCEADLTRYRVARRQPLSLAYRDARILTNPPPSVGGLLVSFGLSLLRDLDLAKLRCGSAEHLGCLVRVMAATQEARLEQGVDDGCLETSGAPTLLDEKNLAHYRQALQGRVHARRGTTHISVIDRAGDIASLTVSNGEGSGFVIPGTGIMTNNMLGEADLHPYGFHRWSPDRRIVSMMAPSVVLRADGRIVGTGSGGSNRIRTAILQVMSNILDFEMPVAQAVRAPRIHFEDDFLNIEGGFRHSDIGSLQRDYPRHKIWPGTHLFFGGVHTAMLDTQSGELFGYGDPRRGGVSSTVTR